LNFVRFVTARSEQAATALLDRVAHGVGFAITEATRYGRENPSARRFADQIIKNLTRGLGRLELTPSPHTNTAP
jgi:hypothetical protein